MNGIVPSGFPTQTLEALDDLAQITSLSELNSYGYHQEKLFHGAYNGMFSIRINDQWRIVFTWDKEEGAKDVEVVDYH